VATGLGDEELKLDETAAAGGCGYELELVLYQALAALHREDSPLPLVCSSGEVRLLRAGQQAPPPSPLSLPVTTSATLAAPPSSQQLHTTAANGHEEEKHEQGRER
jgi:hypothetical protein